MHIFLTKATDEGAADSMDEKNDISILSEVTQDTVEAVHETEEESETYSESTLNDDSMTDDSLGENTLGTMVKKIFAVAMSIISLTAAVYLGIYFTGKLDFSAESIIKFSIASVTGREATVIAVQKQEPAEALEENVPIIQYTATETTAETAEKYEIIPIHIELSNETPYDPDIDELLSGGRIIPTCDVLYEKYGEDEPIVLILHTHGSESYSDTADTDYRSEDSAKNVVALGDIVSDILTANGINNIHSRELYDTPDFNMSYYNASLAIKKYINEYPSISYIIDIHRDSIMDDSGKYYAPTAVIDEKVSAAQIMFVVGTDHGGSGHTEWRDNLTFAARLQCGISSDYPSLMRNINLRSASFNEQYSKGSVIVEIGSCASSLDEAKTSADIFARQLCREIIG